MAANRGWFADWWQAGQYPPVWFAPADEEHLTPPETWRPKYRSGAGFTVPVAPVIKPVEDEEALLLFLL